MENDLLRCVRSNPVNVIQVTVIRVNSDQIDKLGVAVLPSISFQARLVGFDGRRFRFLPEPGGAAA